MTDKQIIIDEINAKAHAKTAFELAKESLIEKDQLKKYYDKLLWRKEQECEELNKTITNLENIRDEFSAKLNQLQAENIKFALDSKKLISQYSAKLERLKQTLTEIKVFLEYEFYGENIWVKEKILQKISEVENEN